MATPVSDPKRRRLRRWLVVCALGLLAVTGCRSVGYYRQAIAGQYEIFFRQEPISTLLARTNTTPALRMKLQLVLDLRVFAETNLQLKAEGHYAKYADLGRRFVVWNVNAAPEFSLEPQRWWYPVVGRLKYRGFFAEPEAREYGARLAAEGSDVYVGGVEAYSTLGWFKDPVLNTFINHLPADLAETLFHELAHQRVFASGDTDFNEAFATCVGEEGTRRWLAAQGDIKARADYGLELRRKNQFVALVMQAREHLQQIYAGPGQPEELRVRKAAAIAALRAEYQKVKAGWGGYNGYDRWFERPINNAQLNTVATYQTLVPAFEVLRAQAHGDWEKFYVEASILAKLPKKERQERMAALGKTASQTVSAER